jgi:dihydrodipicolinate synthase/N-acetylneuraminate lyase
MKAALEAQTVADRIIYAMLSHGNIPPTRAILEAQGFDVGNATFPARRYTDEQKAKIIADMRAAGLEI